METTQGKANKYILPIAIGVIIGIIKVIISSIHFSMFASDYITTRWMMASSIIVTIIGLIVTGNLHKRKSNTTANFKTTFQAIFIVVLIAISISYFYEFFRLETSPEIIEKMYSADTAFAKTLRNAPQRLEQLKQGYEATKTQKPTFSNLTTQLLSYIVWYSILGFIFALILNRKKTGATA